MVCVFVFSLYVSSIAPGEQNMNFSQIFMLKLDLQRIKHVTLVVTLCIHLIAKAEWGILSSVYQCAHVMHVTSTPIMHACAHTHTVISQCKQKIDICYEKLI
jgi:hypothetical protein